MPHLVSMGLVRASRSLTEALVLLRSFFQDMMQPFLHMRLRVHWMWVWLLRKTQPSVTSASASYRQHKQMRRYNEWRQKKAVGCSALFASCCLMVRCHYQEAFQIAMGHRRVNTNSPIFKMYCIALHCEWRSALEQWYRNKLPRSGLKIDFLLLRRFHETSKLVLTAPRRQYGQSATSNYDAMGFSIY